MAHFFLFVGSFFRAYFTKAGFFGVYRVLSFRALFGLFIFLEVPIFLAVDRFFSVTLDRLRAAGQYPGAGENLQWFSYVRNISRATSTVAVPRGSSPSSSGR